MLKADMSRGFTTTATELLFAFGLMDFSQAESGLVLTALPYCYGAPNPKLKSALVQVEHGPWLASQRDKSAAYKAIRRLVDRQVMRATSKGRYILNTRYGEWLDRTGALVFTEGTQALAALQKLLAIRPYWRDTNAGQDTPEPTAETTAETVDVHPPAAPESGHTSTGGSGHTSPKSGHTSTEAVDTHPPESGHTSTTATRKPATASTAAPDANSRLLLDREKQASRTLDPAIRAFAETVCLLSPAQVREVENFAADFAPADLTAALERLASVARPANPVGFIRALAGKLATGATVTLPAGARTFKAFKAQWLSKQRLMRALQPQKQSTSATEADPAARLERITEAARDSVDTGNESARPLAEAATVATTINAKQQQMRADAQAFTERSPNQQQGVIEFARSSRRLLPMIRTAERWIQAGRPALDTCPIPNLTADLAILEVDGRRMYDERSAEGAELETVEIKAPSQRS